MIPVSKVLRKVGPPDCWNDVHPPAVAAGEVQSKWKKAMNVLWTIF
jgi:hypothetical protein